MKFERIFNYKVAGVCALLWALGQFPLVSLLVLFLQGLLLNKSYVLLGYLLIIKDFINIAGLIYILKTFQLLLTKNFKFPHANLFINSFIVVLLVPILLIFIPIFHDLTYTILHMDLPNLTLALVGLIFSLSLLTFHYKKSELITIYAYVILFEYCVVLLNVVLHIFLKEFPLSIYLVATSYLAQMVEYAFIGLLLLNGNEALLKRNLSSKKLKDKTE